MFRKTPKQQNNIIAWYTPGISQSRLEGAVWNTYYYHCDGQGTTRELTDSLQRLTDAYAYNAYGEDLGELRDQSDPAKPVNPLRYVGKEGYYTDIDTGLMLLGARYYDPLIGRFITQDSSRDGANRYEYAGNNPVNAVDPTGLFTKKDKYTFYAAWWFGRGASAGGLKIKMKDVNFGDHDYLSCESPVRKQLKDAYTPRTISIDEDYSYSFSGGLPEAAILGSVKLHLKGTLWVNRGRWAFRCSWTER